MLARSHLPSAEDSDPAIPAGGPWRPKAIAMGAGFILFACGSGPVDDSDELPGGAVVQVLQPSQGDGAQGPETPTAPLGSTDPGTNVGESELGTTPPVILESTPDRSRPGGWTDEDTYRGEPIVRSVRTFRDGSPRRVAYYLPGPEIHESLHGPEWQFFPNGTLRSAQFWTRGTLEGPFRAWYPSGLLHWDGVYSEGRRDGAYTQYHKGGDLQFEYHYRSGLPEGIWREYLASGLLSVQETFLAGVLHGRRQTWVRAEGTDPQEDVQEGEEFLVLDETYEGGKLHGTQTHYHTGTNTPRSKREYSHGEGAGLWQTFFPTGELETRCEYAGGKKHGLEEFFTTDGMRVLSKEYREGIGQGLLQTWYPNGGLQSAGQLVEGLRSGEWVYHRADGSLNEVWSGTYKDDEKVQDSPKLP